MSVPYKPQKGDIISLHFATGSGSEQRGWRPALVISNDLFNRRTGMAMVCPITNTDRGYPFHVAIDQSIGANGFAMVDQVRSIDFAARRAKHIARAPSTLVDEVLAVLDACLY